MTRKEIEAEIDKAAEKILLAQNLGLHFGKRQIELVRKAVKAGYIQGKIVCNIASNIRRI